MNWVSIKEKTPQPGQQVLAAHDNDGWVSTCELIDGIWFNIYDKECPCYPTHWMPLPSPPSEKDGPNTVISNGIAMEEHPGLKD